MAEVDGRLCTCDRCGEMVFRKYIEDRDTDGGFTRWNVFEPFPEGWELHSDTGRLCPACNAKYKSLIENFMRITEVKDNG